MLVDSLIAKSRMEFMQPRLAVENGSSGVSSVVFHQWTEISTFRAQCILLQDKNPRLIGKIGYSLSKHHGKVEVWPLVQTGFLTSASLKGNLNLSVVSSAWFWFFQFAICYFSPSFPFFPTNQIIDFRLLLFLKFLIKTFPKLPNCSYFTPSYFWYSGLFFFFF